jgi:hypothetical protein
LPKVTGKFAGSRLAVRSLSSDELLIELVADRLPNADRDESSHGLTPVAVPTRLKKYHRAAREFRNSTKLHEISRKSLPRAVRIVHAVAVEAERRGYQVACVHVTEDSYGRREWRPPRDGQLVFTTDDHQLNVRIWEKGTGPRGPYEHQLKRWRHDREQPVRLMQFVERPKAYDSAASGELNIEALSRSYGRQKSWGDRSRWTLEDRLPHLLRELKMQVTEAEERRVAREREQAERQRQWEAAMDDAKRRLLEDHGLEVLRKRVREWEEAEAIRAKAQQLPRMPAEPEATPERLKPYLKGWSPYGPRGS